MFGISVLLFAAMVWSLLWEEAPSRLVPPLSADDRALQDHYRRVDAWRVGEMRRGRAASRREWDDLGYPAAVWASRGIGGVA